MNNSELNKRYLDREVIAFDVITNAILKNKAFLFILMLISSICLLGYSYTLQEKFKSDALLMTSDDIVGNDSGSNYGALASLAGFSFGDTSRSDKSVLAIEVIKSRDFLQYLIEEKAVNINDLYHEEISFDDLHEIFNKDIISINKDKNSGFIRITTIHPDPFFAKELIEIIINRLNFKLKQKDLIDSKIALEYLNDQYSKKTLTNLRDSINSLVEEQLQIQMLANVKEDYVFSFIDKPYIPIKKDSPIRFIYIILGLFSGLVFGLIYVFIKEFIKK